MNKKTLAIFLVSMVLVCALSIMGTIAYLTGQSETVTNTFVSGNVTISLDEAKMNAEGTALVEPAARTEGNATNKYKMIPGTTYTKDPTIHVKAGSENCYLGAAITVTNTNLLGGLDADLEETFGIELNEGWVPYGSVNTDNNTWTFLVVNNNVCNYNAESVQDFAIFNNMTIPNLSGDQVTAATGNTPVEIKVTAYAVQQTGFSSAAAAMNGAFGDVFTTLTPADPAE